MSSAVFNPSKVSSSSSHLFPTTISSAVKMIKFQHIAPAPPAGADSKTRKYSPRGPNASPYSVDQTQSVQRRNARERNRVKQVNNSFARLRQHIPQTIISDLTKGGGRGPHKKISKVDTLRIAVEYIRRLQDLIDELNSGSESDCSSYGSATSMLKDTPASPPPVAVAVAVPPTSVSPAQGQTVQQLYATLPTQFPTGLLTPVSLHAYSPPQMNTQAQTRLPLQLDGGCHSPTSSYNSSMSFDSGTLEQTQQFSPPHTQAAGHESKAALAQIQLKFEPYDSFALHDEDCAPDDDEILDYISLWQEQ